MKGFLLLILSLLALYGLYSLAIKTWGEPTVDEKLAAAEAALLAEAKKIL